VFDIIVISKPDETMEGSSSSSNNDASESKSGCGCSSAAVDNNNDATAAAAAAAAKTARRTAALVAAKRAAKTAAFLASAAQEQRHREYLAIQAEREQQKNRTGMTTQADDHHQAAASSSDDPADAAVGARDYDPNDPDPEGKIFAAAVRAVMSEHAAAEESEITITVSPTTGGQFDLSVLKTDSVESLKKVISKRLRVPKERICLLYRERWDKLIFLHFSSFSTRLSPFPSFGGPSVIGFPQLWSTPRAWDSPSRFLGAPKYKVSR